MEFVRQKSHIQSSNNFPDTHSMAFFKRVAYFVLMDQEKNPYKYSIPNELVKIKVGMITYLRYPYADLHQNL